MRSLLGLLIMGLSVAAAAGQQPYPYPPTFPAAPSVSPQQTRPGVRPPLSPYLNLLNGVNPALNYYYGVQPFTQPPRSLPPGTQTGFAPAAPGTFFRPTQPPPEAVPYPEPADRQRFKLPSPGSPVTYGTGSGTAGRPGLFVPTASPSAAGAAPGSLTQPPNTIPRSR
jgi:hypothetical protein